MKKIFLINLLIIPFLLSGCALFEEENELANAEIDYVIDEVVNANVNAESASAEEATADEEEELKLEDVFVGEWWLHMQYSDFKSISKIDVKKGSYNSRGWYQGKMESLASTIYDEAGTTEAEPDGELIDFEIDGQKIDISAEGASLYGIIKISEEESYASGDFISTIGTGTWYMTNKKPE